DLYVLESSDAANQVNRLYENQGDGTFAIVDDGAGAAGTTLGVGESVTTADYDLDGFLDLYVANGEGPQPNRDDGINQLFRNQGNQNHWLEIDLRSTESNRDGLGAQVLVTAGGVTQLREQAGGIHTFSQNHSRLHFGLANNEVVDTIEIRWPSGAVQVLENIETNKLIQVTEATTDGDTNDFLVGDDSNDFMAGLGGDDTLKGSRGDDTLEGGSGNDVIIVNDFSGVDILDGGAGFDRLRLLPIDGRSLSVFLEIGGVSDRRVGGQFLQNFERVLTGRGDDRLVGDENDNQFFSADGQDTLTGGAGDDLLAGGVGNDVLTGGSGSDAFYLAAEEGTDLITDFAVGEDLIALVGGLSVSDLSFAGNLILLEEQELALLDGVDTTALTAADFTMVP
ncbi:MAG: ASPIC/UnbV domain-containing protein, partial [Cyanobacteria bacterium P01_A01_bin.17]